MIKILYFRIFIFLEFAKMCQKKKPQDYFLNRSMHCYLKIAKIKLLAFGKHPYDALNSCLGRQLSPFCNRGCDSHSTIEQKE